MQLLAGWRGTLPTSLGCKMFSCLFGPDTRSWLMHAKNRARTIYAHVRDGMVCRPKVSHLWLALLSVYCIYDTRPTMDCIQHQGHSLFLPPVLFFAYDTSLLGPVLQLRF